MSNGKYFIDSHCHLFNIEDIPITALLSRFIDKDMMKLYPVLAVPGIALLTAATKAREEFEKFKPFLLFFERRIADNIALLMDDMDKALVDSDIPIEGGYRDRTRILTPLIMDFQVEVSHKKVDYQQKRLTDAIKSLNKRLKDRSYVLLPFAGYDLRKLKDIDTFFEKHKFRQAGDALESGKIAGLKLYPPIGFNPGKKEYLPFFRKLAKAQVPVTAHCQPGSYKIHSSEDIEGFTHPRNWKKVLDDDKARKLRINFAHFGGEDEVDETTTFTLRNFGSSLYELKREDTWTYWIVRLLKDYPNTYADISAFNYKKRSAVNSLGSLLLLDEEGKLSNPAAGAEDHPLKEKLIWGSDYPMHLHDFPSYQDLFDNFLKAILENDAEFSNKQKILENMICTNPKEFLQL